MAKKNNKRTKEQDEALLLYLLSMIPKKKFITDNTNSGAILNTKEQPIMLSSDFDKDLHHFSLERGNGFTIPGKGIVYLINGLQKMLEENAKKYFKGDVAAMTAYMNSVQGPVEVFDLNDLSAVDPVMLQELYDLLDKAAKSGKLSPSDLEQSIEKLGDIANLIEEVEDKIKRGKLSPEEQQELKDVVLEKMELELKELEAKLVGKSTKQEEVEIDFAYLEKILNKHGPEAVAEELRRVPAEKRDELLAKLITLKEFKPKE